MANEKLIEKLEYIRSLGYDWYEYKEQEMRNPVTDESWVERTVVFPDPHGDNLINIVEMETTDMMIPLFNTGILQMRDKVDSAIEILKKLNNLLDKN